MLLLMPFSLGDSWFLRSYLFLVIIEFESLTWNDWIDHRGAKASLSWTFARFAQVSLGPGSSLEFGERF